MTRAEFRRGLERLDVMIVLRGAVRSNVDIRPVSPLASELSLKHDLVIFCVHVSEEAFRRDQLV